jgi:hypothetical protein
MSSFDFRTLIKGHGSSGPAPGRRHGGPRRRSARLAPCLDLLEARLLLSTLWVTSTEDGAPGSLRAERGAAPAGDTIEFAPSAYGTTTLTEGPLLVDTSVDIQGPGAKKVTVSGNDESSVFVISKPVTATISGLTVTDALGSFAAGGILNYGALTLSNDVVTGNTAVPGAFGPGGVMNLFGTLTLSDDAITNNTAEPGADGAGGVENFLGTLTIAGTTISGNAGDQGGGINNDGPLSITDSDILNNACPTGSQGGGGILTFASASLTNSVVSGNTGGGIDITTGFGYPTGTLTVSDSAIVNNSGQALGGGISAYSSDVVVTGSTISDNTATTYGGGIYLAPAFFTQSCALTVTDSTFQGNQVIATEPAGPGGGGAIHADVGATISVSGSVFLGNTVTTADDGTGGAIDLVDIATGTITSSTFTGNQVVVVGPAGFSPGAASGGAISNVGGFSQPSTMLTIRGSVFAGNLAQGASGSGGYALGGAIDNEGNRTTLDLASSFFLDNTALGGTAATSGTGQSGGFAFGGAVSNGDGPTAVVSDSTFIGNAAIGGAASGAGNQGGNGDGGAIQTTSPSFTLTGSSLIGNSAVGGAGTDGAVGGTAEGGGIQDFAELQVGQSSILDNIALGGAGGGNGEGGGVFISGPSATARFTGSLIAFNQAVGGHGGGSGYGGGLYIATGAITTLTNTKVAGNFASTAGDEVYGTYING